MTITTNDEATKIVERIAKPVFNYMLKRINKEIIENKSLKTLPLNMFINILVAAIGSTDANMLRWIEVFHKIKTNNEIDFEGLHMSLMSRINDNLKVLTR